jgi:hypothetical protein
VRYRLDTCFRREIPPGSFDWTCFVAGLCWASQTRSGGAFMADNTLDVRRQDQSESIFVSCNHRVRAKKRPEIRGFLRVPKQTRINIVLSGRWMHLEGQIFKVFVYAITELEDAMARRPGGETKPNEARPVKCLDLRDMRDKFRKRSQMNYPQFFQCLRTKKRPFFRNYERFGGDANYDLSPGVRQQVRPKPECPLESGRSGSTRTHPSMNWKPPQNWGMEGGFNGSN